MPSLRTYIVEDSAVIRDSLIAALEELLPIEVVGTADDETTASQWLQRSASDHDLVIIDIFLKSGSGLGVLRTALAAPQRHKLVVLSNYTTPEMRLKCLALGADEVFDKSHELEELLRYCGTLAAAAVGAASTATLN